MSRAPLSDAISFYDDLLQGDVLRRTHEHLQQAAESKGVTLGGRVLYRSLRPYFVTPEQHADIQRAARAVGQALEAVAWRAAGDAAFRESLYPQGWEEMMIPVDGQRPGLGVIGRLDGFVGADGVLRFIEFNPYPGGPINSHSMGEAFDTSAVMEAFSKRYEVVRPATAPNLVTSLNALKARAGRSGPPTLALFGPPGPDDADEEVVYQQYLKENGWDLRIVTSEDDWTYADGVLRVGDFPVDVITFISSIGFGGLMMGCGPDHPVMRAITDGSANFMNGLFRSTTLRNKTLFATLSRMADEGAFGAAQDGLIQRHIPWTRVVRDGKTLRDGASVDLLSYVAGHREHLVLKPAFNYGGQGVTLGWNTDADTWSATLKQALEETWVVQERLELVKAPYPVFDGGQVRHEALHSDLNPFLWEDGRPEGFLVRLAPGAMLNMSQGGSLTTVAVVRER
ncbi:hypothetical protein D7Y13_12180 [Corallococcus praedator]|uniref:Circularly permuted type 2 ATP-grasp protein n=1 Tax=Corallococcus praedator TaxID=2316724 RepID=A0ABX9QJX1_9BACT|nr:MULTISPECIES: hypothetical protein [Corallococcus]RKH17719.1 hypothetical protein D7X74_11625 [Corallococcus sp. CA047B]RKH31644.1 hypothetical protein D7X75_18710 [Corallococcus sp. CA031C]RKI10728.1 hypothetical protein D7Y13_12180 [Corallococcus praedator]